MNITIISALFRKYFRYNDWPSLMHNPVIMHRGPPVSCARHATHMAFYPVAWARYFIFLNSQRVANNLSEGLMLMGRLPYCGHCSTHSIFTHSTKYIFHICYVLSNRAVTKQTKSLAFWSLDWRRRTLENTYDQTRRLKSVRWWKVPKRKNGDMKFSIIFAANICRRSCY